MIKKDKILQFFPVLILIIAFILRTFKLKEFFYFTFDEEVIAFISKRMIVDHHFPLIGGVTPFHFHLGPYFYYLSAVILFLSHLNPLGWGVFAALISCLCIYLTYKTGKTIFNQRVAFLASFFYTFSFLQIIYDRHYWPLTLNPLLTLLALYSLIQIKKNANFSFLLAPSLIFALHTDPSNWLLLPVSLLVYFWQKLKFSKKQFFAFCLIFLSCLSLVLFDLRHDFVNCRGIIQYLQEQNGGTPPTFYKLVSTVTFIPKAASQTLFSPFGTEISRLQSSCQSVAQERIISQPLFLVFFTAFVIISPLFILQKHKKNSNKNLFWKQNLFLQFYFLFLIFLIIGLNIFGNLFDGPIFEHYLTGFSPLFYLSLSLFLSLLFKSKFKILIPVFIGVFSIACLNSLTNLNNDYNLKNKTEAIKWTVNQLKNQEFTLDSLSKCFRYGGFRYLFYLEQKEPALSFVDPQLFWLYDKRNTPRYPKLLVVFVSHDFDADSKEYNFYERYKQKLIKSQTFGKLEVLIVNNSNEDFKIVY